MAHLRAVFASALVAFAPWTASAALTQIGAAAAVKGIPRAKSSGESVGRVVQSGKPLFQNDHVTTDANSRFQILLKDETVFTLGPNSDMVLDEFVYDPKTENGRVTATITKGVFRFVTGKIANAQPSSMKVKLPTGTIGIRGTIVAGIASPGMCAVMLAGPGAGNNANARAGAFELSNGRGATTVSVAGEGSISEANKAPTPAGPLPASVVGEINAGLAAAPSPESSEEASSGSGSGSSTTQPDEDSGGSTAASEEPSAAEESGDATASGGETAAETEVAAELNSSAGATATQGSQENTKVAAGVADGLSSWEHVKSLQTGTGWFFSGHKPISCSGCTSSAPVGALHLKFDFGNRTLGGADEFPSPYGFTYSFIHVHGVYQPGEGDRIESAINTINYGSLAGNARLLLDPYLDPAVADANAIAGGAAAGGHSFAGSHLRLENSGGVVAAEAIAELEYSATAPNPARSASGEVVAPR
ncbi:MAG: FecR domain-containing protein [Elusimicrobia bacterium]|nr:FecR domain-containing protein [Elusimicrobiota bacterium]